jgi:peptidoglycan/LPS O-acetylase OafA/YrhL
LQVEIPQLTFLRFVAAIGIVIFHRGKDVESLAWGEAVWERANTAVSFFFVLSGFILAHVYAGRSGPKRAFDFYVARLARVAPVYWLALLAVALYALSKGRFAPIDFALSAVLLQAWWSGRALVLNSPGWSLSVEFFFYLCFPFLFTAAARLRSTPRLVAVAFGAWALNLGLHVILIRATEATPSPVLLDFAFYHPLTHVGTFIVGVVSGVLFERHRPTLERLALPLVVGAVAVFSVFILIPNPIVEFHHNGLFAPVFVAFIWGLASSPGLALSRLFSLAPLVLLGHASYGVYILQQPVWHVCAWLGRRLSLSADGLFWSYVLVLVLVSVACFKWIEAPSRELIKHAYAKRFRVRGALQWQPEAAGQPATNAQAAAQSPHPAPPRSGLG